MRAMPPVRPRRATAAVSEARVGVTEATLEKTRLIAPFDGVVAEINGELNEYVTPSPIGIPTPPAIDLIDNQLFLSHRADRRGRRRRHQRGPGPRG